MRIDAGAQYDPVEGFKEPGNTQGCRTGEGQGDGLWVHYSLNERSFNKYAVPLLELLKDWANDDEVILKDLEELSRAVRLSEVSGRCAVS